MTHKMPPAAIDVESKTAPADPMKTVPDTSAEVEHRYHTYMGTDVPIYVRLMWVGFYLLAAWYVVVNMFPAIQSEFRPRIQQQRPQRPAN